jgi:putative transposase
VEQEKANHSIVTMCRVFKLSTSGYYAWRKRKPSERSLKDKMLKELIREIYDDSDGTYGAPRIHAELNLELGIPCSKKRVARLMREEGLVGVHRRKTNGCTKRDPARPVYPDLVERCFTATEPNQLWVADITQHYTSEGWLYLAVIIDLFSRIVAGWSMSEKPVAGLVVNALNMAVWNRRPDKGLVHHSDHGAQYTSLAFSQRLQDTGILGSMGTVGDALDNAAAESFYATLQTELLDRYSWPTRSKLRSAIFEYIEVFYNRKRRHSSLEYLSPAVFEERWFNQTKLKVSA